MAVAGFSEAELDITLHEQMLIIAGQTADAPEAEGREYLYRGIASRQFERRFQLADFIQIESAELKDGDALHINLVRRSEAMKPQGGDSKITMGDLKKKKRV